MRIPELLILLLLLFVMGCRNGPQVEICYEHPTYGSVCVKLGGHELKRTDLTPEQQKEVEIWLLQQKAKTRTETP